MVGDLTEDFREDPCELPECTDCVSEDSERRERKPWECLIEESPESTDDLPMLAVSVSV